MTVEEQADLEKVTKDLKNAESLPLTVEEQAELERLTRKFASGPNRFGDDAFFARLVVDMKRTGPFYAPQTTVIRRILRVHGFDEKFTAGAHEVEDGKLTLIAYAADRVTVPITADERADLERVRRALHEALQDASGGTREDIDVFEPEIEFIPRQYPRLRPHVKAFRQTLRRILRAHGFDKRYTGATEGAGPELSLIAYLLGKTVRFGRPLLLDFLVTAPRRLVGRFHNRGQLTQ